MAKDSQRGSSADDERELPDESTGEDEVDDVEPSEDDLDDSVADDDPDLDDVDDTDDEDDDLEDDKSDDDETAVGAAAARRDKKSKTSSTATKKKAAQGAKSQKKASPIAGAAPGTFIQQVISEMSKVVWPTKKQMITYTTVVLIFVVVLVSAVWGFDLGVGSVMDWIFA